MTFSIYFFFRAPPMCLLPNSHYEQVITAFGGKGYFVQTPKELQESLRQSLADTTKPSLINIMIEPQAMRKAQVNVIAKQKTEMHLYSHPPKYLLNRTPCNSESFLKPFMSLALSFVCSVNIC